MKRILEDVKKFKGNVLCVGVTDKKNHGFFEKKSQNWGI